MAKRINLKDTDIINDSILFNIIHIKFLVVETLPIISISLLTASNNSNRIELDPSQRRYLLQPFSWNELVISFGRSNDKILISKKKETMLVWEKSTYCENDCIFGTCAFHNVV